MEAPSDHVLAAETSEPPEALALSEPDVPAGAADASDQSVEFVYLDVAPDDPPQPAQADDDEASIDEWVVVPRSASAEVAGPALLTTDGPGPASEPQASTTVEMVEPDSSASADPSRGRPLLRAVAILLLAIVILGAGAAAGYLFTSLVGN
jgi:hypothetical protein